MLTIQPLDWLGGQVAGVYQHDTNYLGSPGLTTNWYSAGGRAAVAFAKHGKLLGEAGYDRASTGAARSQYLAKFTGAIALTADRGFLSRPELRLFYTWARWNPTAATAPGSTPAIFTPRHTPTC